MQAAPAAAPAAPIAGAAPAAPSPMYTPPPPPMPPAPPAMAEGGAVEGGGSSRGGGVGGKIKEFFEDINILDVTISAFIVGGVLYAVHYFKFMMMMEKAGYADLSAKIQKIESQMAAAKKSAEANATGNGGMRRKRALMSL